MSEEHPTHLTHPTHPPHLCYVIYTSGTTGKPKGVLTTHWNAVRVVKNTNYIELTESDRILQLSNYAFDGSVFDIYGALLNGSALVLVGKDRLMALNKLGDLIEREAVTVFFVTTALFNALVDLGVDCLVGIRKVLFGGEKVSVPHSRKALEYLGKDKIIHVYGPTETTVYATYYFVDVIDEVCSTIPIGGPISNTTVYILDCHLHPVPVGAAGEVYIGGDGVARGYLNKPELTAEKFVRLTLDTKHLTLYNTGDLARWLPTGNIEFSGRIDHQVKLRGFRVELGEIESHLENHPVIKETVVIVREDNTGEKQLGAYIVCEDKVREAPGVEELRTFLAERVPDYMIPSYFIPLDKIPLTPNGKVDRKALPVPKIRSEKGYTAPRTEMEKKLAGIWSGVLGLDGSEPDQRLIGIDDNFFQLGGHSIKAAVMVSKVHKILDVKLPLAEVFKRRTIRELAGYLQQAKKSKYTDIEPVEEKEYYELSSAQKRLYFLQQMKASSITYNIPLVLPIEKDIEIDKLKSVFKKLIERHESLRTSFERVNDEAVQRVHDPGTIEFVVEYYPVEDQDKVEQVIDHFIQPFDLSRAPLIRSGIVKNPDGRRIWMVDMHHIVSDGTSYLILTRDFMSLYNGEELAPLRLQYKDFCRWQNRLSRSGAIKAREDYWLKLYTDIGEIPRLNFPGDHKRPEVFTFTGDQYSFELDRDDALKFKALGTEIGGTLYMNTLAVLNALFYTYTGQTDIIIGSVTAGRAHADLQDIIGMFVNTVTMRNQPEGEKSYRSFLKELIARSVEAFENQDVQFEELVKKLEPQRDLSRNPLFDVLMVVQNMEGGKPVEEAVLPVVEGEIPYANKTAKFDMTFFVVEQGEDIHIDVSYYTGIFKKETIRRLASHFKRLIKIVVADPFINLKDIDIISEEERREILFRFNDTVVEYPGDKTVHRLFEEQAERTPDGVGLVGKGHGCMDAWMHGNICITYRELDKKSDRLACMLRERGVLADNIVAIKVERSIDMIIGILGILKAGGAYLPVDPDYPQERIRYMLKDSGVKILLTGNELSSWLSSAPEAFLNLPEGRLIHHPGNLAYVLYTSGSTGEPKAALIRHGNVHNLIWGLERCIYRQYAGCLKVAFVSPYYFDASVKQIFGALLQGHCLHVVPEGTRVDGERLMEYYAAHCIDISDGTPTHLRLLLESCITDTFPFFVRHFIIGGEALPNKVVEDFFRRFAGKTPGITNIYGVTECAVDSTFYEIGRGGLPAYDTFPIGKPLPNSFIYILNRENNLQPVGIVGELCIAGDGVGRGYLNNPELTKEKFQIPNSKLQTNSKFQITNESQNEKSFNKKFLRDPGAVFIKRAPGRRRQKIYKTGDLARWLPDGNIEFLGRIDHQVKIRGYRLEPGEIESRLLSHGKIKNAVVVAKVDRGGDYFLCAYVVTVPGYQDGMTEELRTYLSGFMPGYMVPAYFIQLENIPLTPNGKVDRKALPEPELKSRPAGEDRAVPLDAVQQRLVEIWAGVLNIEKENIGITAGFFDIGGHSLNATVLAARIHKEFDVKIPLERIFNTPTINGLSAYIRRTQREHHISIEPAEEKEYYPLSSAQRRLYVLHQLASGSVYYNMPHVIEMQETVNKETLETAFKKLIARHESLRTSFETVNEKPVQKIHKTVDFSVDYYEVAEDEIEHIITNFTRPFDLSKAPVLRVNLLDTGNSRRVLLIDMHHIITDGMSQAILRKEFTVFYSEQVDELPPLKLQYKDYSGWLNSSEQKELRKKQETYWLKEFAYDDELPVLNLPTDYPRPLLQSFEGNWVLFALSAREIGILKDIAKENDVTFYMMLLAVFSVLFSKLCGQEDIVFGTPVAARRHADLQHMIGMMVNTLPMRNYPSGDKSFKEFLKEVKQRTLDAYENQEYPFEEMVDHIAVNRDTSRNPLFDVLLNLLNREESPEELPDMNIREQPPYRHEKRTSRFDMSFTGVDLGRRIYFNLEYSTRLFTAGTIERLIQYLKNIILSLQLNTKQKILDIEYITGEEKEAILEFSSGVREIPAVEPTVHGMFEEKAAQVPDHIALVFKNQHIGYGELNRRSSRLARVLRENGVGTGAVVGVMVQRSLEMIIALLAVLKAGGAYVPIDPEYPEQRILTMLEDSRASLLLATGNLVGRFSVTALKGMKGVEPEEELVVTPAQTQIKNFDAIPIPDRTLIDYERYHRYIGEAPAKNTITMQATRGCPYNCLYCHKIWPKTHVARSAGNVFKEISYAYEAGVRRFVFIDDIFNLDKKNAEQLLETIVKSGLDIRLFFPNGFRADILSRDFIDLMMAAGTVNLDVALESASPRIQRLIKKNLNLEKFKENVQYITRKYPQVILEMEMMHGFPTESEEEAMMTLDFLKELQWVHFPNLHVLKIFPNTDMCRFAIESGISEA
ncbi:MAG: amino acid adenylation domain-containing protein, partial [Candidatus Aminicenantes bacterium]|nr:amino acid adenylation domain-containing protein [Candidatus Aminicenantes bacterium]NIM82358.1 amino acid adenylation domain-containing protein [Candidatus Aminicenantes bacterium]NIN21741.1 amino acid adenylation domain-containing protein [Candidatus Aminicenantes bacterium]NIN45550.1 amino acid adenylation domain-containing protein [Candidatus Aminicenantes bacterium]NIN88381.1 amino acid adenylation domain-containing protein [Candidatus Aminicenantes bacterium]